MPTKSETPTQMGRQVAQDLSRMVNLMGNDEAVNAFVDYLTIEDHRTLQQCVMSTICKIIKKHAAKGEHECDGRNEATVKLCKEIVKKVGEDQLFLPFI